MRCGARGEAGLSVRLWVERVLCSVWRNWWCEVEGVVWESMVLHMSFSGLGSGSRSGQT